MQRFRTAALLAIALAIAACGGGRTVVVADIGKAAETLAAESLQRLSAEPYRGLPVVVRAASNEGAEGVLAELLRTRLAERGAALEVACPAKCMEINLVEFVTQAPQAGGAGDVVALPPKAELRSLVRVPGAAALAPGEAQAAFVTIAVRDGNRYTARQHLIAWLGLAKSADPGR